MCGYLDRHSDGAQYYTINAIMRVMGSGVANEMMGRITSPPFPALAYSPEEPLATLLAIS
jgi:hypothetical protein